MPAGSLHFEMGPITRPVSAAVTAGRLVEVTSGTNTDGKVNHAAAGSKKVLGMAKTDAAPRSSAPTDQIDPTFAPPHVGIYYGPADVKLQYSAAAADGELLVATANGCVGPAGAGTFDQVVARCTQPGGVASAGEGYARLHL